MRFWKKILSIGVIALMVGIGVFAQQKPDFISVRKPIIFGRAYDGFPSSMLLKGTIADVDFREPRCGDIATAGTLKIRPDTKVDNLRSKFVYVVVFCAAPSDRKKFVGKKVEIAVSKLMKFPYTFSVFVSNKFYSMGIPFYLANDVVGGELDKLVN